MLQHNKMTEKEFEIKFGPYLDTYRPKIEERTSAADSAALRDNLQRINTVLGQNTEELKRNVEEESGKKGYTDPVNVAYKKFVEDIAEHMLAKRIIFDKVMNSFDKNTNGFISESEFQTAVTAIGGRLTAKEIELLFRHFDPKVTRRINSKDLREELRPLVQKRALELMESKKKQTTQLNDLLIETVILYMRKHHLSAYDLYKMIDSDLDNNVSSREFGQFLRRLDVKLTDKQIDDLIQAFDKDGNGKVNFNEFVTTIKEHTLEAPPMNLSTQEILETVATHMVENNITISTIFTEFDKNKDGFISRVEMEAAFEKLGFKLPMTKTRELHAYFDYNKDNKVSIKEFVDGVTPFYEKAQKNASAQKSPTQGRLQRQGTQSTLLENLRKKVKESVRLKHSSLKQVFRMYREGETAFITKDNFRKVMVDLEVGLTSSEVTLVLENFVELNGKNEVNWEKFLSTFSDLDNLGGSKVAESQYLSSHDVSLNKSHTAETIFRSIAKILKEKHISRTIAFQIFDKDKTGRITHKEFK